LNCLEHILVNPVVGFDRSVLGQLIKSGRTHIVLVNPLPFRLGTQKTWAIGLCGSVRRSGFESRVLVGVVVKLLYIWIGLLVHLLCVPALLQLLVLLSEHLDLQLLLLVHLHQLLLLLQDAHLHVAFILLRDVRAL